MQRDEIPPGTLYLLILKTLALHGELVRARWDRTETNRRARYYKLTAAGRKQLVVEVSQFERVMGAVARVIQTA